MTFDVENLRQYTFSSFILMIYIITPMFRSTCRRSLDKKEWEEIHEKLSTWLSSLQVFRTNLEQIIQVGT